MNRTATSAPRRAWPLRDRPGLVWLALAATVAVAHRFVPASGWLMVHLVLLGALTHSAMVWSTHFTQALLKTPHAIDDRTQQNRRIGLLLAGVTAVLVGVPTGWWPLTLAGATAVSGAVVWHGIQLWRRLRRALPGRFRVTVRYYLAAAACVPIGATLGAWLARGLDDERHGAVLVAHSMVMVLGWIGLTVTGTLVTLWPTMLRTRIDARAERLARQALPVLLTGLAVLASGAALGSRAAALVGLGGYAAGLLWWGRALVAPARKAPPKVFATWSVSAALGWGAVAIALVGWRLATSASWAALADGYGRSWPRSWRSASPRSCSSGRCPTSSRRCSVAARPSSARRRRGLIAQRSGASPWSTSGCSICLLPSPSAVRVAVSVLVLGALVAFLPRLLRSIGAAVAARRALLVAVDEADAHGVRPAPAPVQAPRVRRGLQLLTAVASLAVVVGLGVAADPAAAGLSTSSGGDTAATGVSAARTVEPSGHTTHVRVEARDMAYVPDSLTVPYGDRLVIDLVNLDDGSPHDLTFGHGIQTGRVMPGRSATLDVGVVGASTQGWCRIIGHRQMGMVLDVVVTGGPAPSTAGGAVTAGGAATHPSTRTRST